MNKSLLGASLFALALAAPIAHAYEAGDILVRYRLRWRGAAKGEAA